MLLGVTAAQARVVTAGQVNGTWHRDGATLKVWALGKQRLKVEFAGIYASGAASATGEAAGIARIDRDTAIFEPAATRRCRITMRFDRTRLLVAENGECGFGVNVTAAGTYTRKSRRKPHFTD